MIGTHEVLMTEEKYASNVCGQTFGQDASSKTECELGGEH
jgi:hypothetical protein